MDLQSKLESIITKEIGKKHAELKIIPFEEFVFLKNYYLKIFDDLGPNIKKYLDSLKPDKLETTVAEFIKTANVIYFQPENEEENEGLFSIKRKNLQIKS